MNRGVIILEVKYLDSKDIRAEDLSRVFLKSGINRPHQDTERIRRMIANSDIVVSAWIGEQMVGVARAITDYSYCCYLSDLAVDSDYQGLGIGKRLVELLREKLGDECSLVLLSAPGAVDYYPKIGFENTDKAFVIKRKK